MSKRIVIDLDDTLCVTKDSDYSNSIPNQSVIDMLKLYKDDGFVVSIHTSRNMRTHNGNVGKINALTLPNIINWLNKHDVPFDEVFVGKPWCGDGGFYVDDRAVRPSEFIKYNYSELVDLLEKEKCF